MSPLQKAIVKVEEAELKIKQPFSDEEKPVGLLTKKVVITILEEMEIDYLNEKK